jgi:hypothetical protein
MGVGDDATAPRCISPPPPWILLKKIEIEIEEIYQILLPKVKQEVVESQCQSYFTTGGLLPISTSWRQAP